jgi:hypothetical protein
MMLPHAEIIQFQYGAQVNYKTEKLWTEKEQSVDHKESHKDQAGIEPMSAW